MPRKIILKEGGLNGADAPSGFQFLGFDSETLSLKKGATISAIGGGETGVKRYIAALTQTGTNAPVATVIRNDFDGEIVWSRVDVGVYFATLTGAFEGQVRVIPPAVATAIEKAFDGYSGGKQDDNSIYLYTTNNVSTGVAADGLLYGEGFSYIEIIKYED